MQAQTSHFRCIPEPSEKLTFWQGGALSFEPGYAGAEATQL